MLITCTLLLDEFNLLKHQVTTCEVCSVEIVQQLANASKDLNLSMNDLNRHAAHVQKAFRDTFRARLLILAERYQTYFQHEVSTIFKFVDQAACDPILSFQGYVAHCQATVREFLE